VPHWSNGGALGGQKQEWGRQGRRRRSLRVCCSGGPRCGTGGPCASAAVVAAAGGGFAHEGACATAPAVWATDCAQCPPVPDPRRRVLPAGKNGTLHSGAGAGTGQCGQVTLGCSPGPRGSPASALARPFARALPSCPSRFLPHHAVLHAPYPALSNPSHPVSNPPCARACKLRGRGHTLSHTRACAHILARAVRLRASSARASRHVRAALPTPPR